MSTGKKESLIEFPCHFPIKVMGTTHVDFENTVFNLIEKLSTNFDRESVDSKPSRTGKYTSLTCKVWVISQDQLDEVYRTLSTHPMVAVVL